MGAGRAFGLSETGFKSDTRKVREEVDGGEEGGGLKENVRSRKSKKKKKKKTKRAYAVIEFLFFRARNDLYVDVCGLVVKQNHYLGVIMPVEAQNRGNFQAVVIQGRERERERLGAFHTRTTTKRQTQKSGSSISN